MRNKPEVKRIYRAKIIIYEKVVYGNRKTATGKSEFDTTEYYRKRLLGTKIINWLVEKSYIPQVYRRLINFGTSEWERTEKFNQRINDFLDKLSS